MTMFKHFLLYGTLSLLALSLVPLSVASNSEHSESKVLATFAPIANHVGLSVADLDAEQRWYQEAFDMRVEQKFSLPNPAVRTVLLRGPNGLGMELIERQGSTRPRMFADALDAALTQGIGHWALTIASLDQEFVFLVSKGARIVSPPAPAVQPGSKFAYVKDPEGNLIELIQLP